MKIHFTKNAQEDYKYWNKNNLKLKNKIDKIIKDIIVNPFTGIGKPEPLKFELQGYWSRRLDREHRIVYKIDNDTLFIVQCRYHY